RVRGRVRPEVIVAPDPSQLWFRNRYINHWDHKQAGTLALCAVMPDAPSRPQFPELLDEGLEPFEVPNLWLASEDADTYVDISQTLENKIQALRAHEAQGVPSLSGDADTSRAISKSLETRIQSLRAPGSQGVGAALDWARERARQL